MNARDEADERRDETQAVAGSVPAGGAGADSGAVDAVDSAPIRNVSSGNDAPGVGTRGAGGAMERGDGDKR